MSGEHKTLMEAGIDLVMQIHLPPILKALTVCADCRKPSEGAVYRDFEACACARCAKALDKETCIHIVVE